MTPLSPHPAFAAAKRVALAAGWLQVWTSSCPSAPGMRAGPCNAACRLPSVAVLPGLVLSLLNGPAGLLACARLTFNHRRMTR